MTTRPCLPCLLFLGLLAASTGARAAPVAFDIPALPAVQALQQFSRQAGIEVMFSFDELRSVRTNELKGRYEPEAALGVLLAATGYHAVRTGPTRFVVRAIPPGRISGTVEALPGGEPVAGARVSVPGTALAVRTGRNGRFRLSGVPAGVRHLALQAPGMAPVRVAAVAVPAGEEVSLRPIAMAPAEHADVELDEVVVAGDALVVGSGPAVRLDAMVVTPGRFGVTDNPALTAATLTHADLETLPQLGEDLFRAIGKLPGLATVDFSAKFWLRGAPNDEVLTRLDGVELLEPYHIKDIDGALAIIDLETVSRLDLTTGGFTTEYGNRLAGVLALETETPAPGRGHTTLGVSLTGFRATQRGTSRDGKGRWLLSARSGYPDIALEIQDKGSTAKPRYYDVFGKFEFAPVPGHTLGLHVLHADDRMTLTEAGEPDLRSSYGSDYAWLRWQAEWGDRLRMETVLSHAQLDWHRRGEGFFGTSLVLDLDDDRELTLTGLRQDWSLLASDQALLKAGFDLQRATADYSYHRVRELNRYVNGAIVRERRTLDRDLSPEGQAVGAHLAWRYRAGEALTLEPGLRFDRQDWTDEAQWSPRFNAVWDLGRTTMRAAWGLFHQAPGLHQIAVADGETGLGPVERAEHRMVGIEHRLRGGINLRAELYERRTPNPRSRWENVIEPYDVFPEVQLDRRLLRPDSARARGVELMVESRAGQRVDWSLVYALARTTERIAGREVPRARDQRHTLHAEVKYAPSPRWQFSAAWQYHSGWPTTEIRFAAAPLNNGGTAIVSSLGSTYAERLPDYHRLDLRATRIFRLRDSTLRVYVDVFNAYDRQNTWRYGDVTNLDGNQINTRRTLEEQFPLLPSLGVIWDF